MGDDEIIKYESGWHTYVFWNFDDYPIPSTANLEESIYYDNINLAFHKMGFHGVLSIATYGRNGKSDLTKASITFNREEDATDWTMSLNVLIWVATSGRPQNLVVVAKQKPGSELFRVLECLQSRNCTVLLLEPPADSADNLFHSVDSVVDCTKVLGGGKPYCYPSDDYPSDDWASD